MAASLISTVLRNSTKVCSANRLVLSNPCLASLGRSQHAVYSSLSKNDRKAPLTVANFKPQTGIRMTSTGDYAKLWTVERFVAAGMVPLVPAAFYIASPVMDYLLAFTFVLHAHWGLEAIVVDYVRPRIVGPTIARLALALVYGLSAFTLGGLFYFNYSDVGIVNAIKMLWKL